MNGVVGESLVDQGEIDRVGKGSGGVPKGVARERSAAGDDDGFGFDRRLRGCRCFDDGHGNLFGFGLGSAVDDREGRCSAVFTIDLNEGTGLSEHFGSDNGFILNGINDKRPLAAPDGDDI